MLKNSEVERVNNLFDDHESREFVCKLLVKIKPSLRVIALDYITNDISHNSKRSWQQISFKTRSILDNLFIHKRILNVESIDYFTAAYINSREKELTSWVDSLCDDKNTSESITSEILKTANNHEKRMNQLTHMFKS